MPLYTNVLTTSEYGVADVITAASTLLVYIFTINIAASVLRFAIDKEENQDEILSYGFRTLIIGSLILLLFLGITYNTKIPPWKDYYYFFIFLYYFSMALYQMMTNYLRAIGKIVDVGIAGVISALSIIAGNIILLLVVKIGIVGYLISLNLGPLLGSVYCFIRAGVPIKRYIICSCDSVTKKQMRAYCIPLIFNDLALWINVFLDKFFVTAICGPDQNGIYAVANKIPTILATVYMVFTQAWNLSAIQEFDKNDEDGFFTKTYSLYNATVVLACSVLIIFNTTIAKILFAKDFFEGWKYSSVLLLAILFNALTSFQGSLFSAVKNTGILAKTTVISAIINISLNILLIPMFGVMGAAVATVSSYVVMWTIRHFKLKTHISLHRNFRIDILAYILLIGQVIAEHFNSHLVPIQIFITLLIVVIYRESYKSLIDYIMKKLVKRRV